MGLPTGAQSPRPLGVLTCQRRYGHALTKTIQMFDRLVLSSPLSPESAANDAIWLDLRADVRLCTADAGWSSSVARWAHNPEVAGSNPVPATSENGPPETPPGAVFMPFGNTFGNISIAI